MRSKNLPDELSIWEIAHRWHGVDLAHSTTPPTKVLDTIRWICTAIDNEQLVAVDYRFKHDRNTTAWERLPKFFKQIRAGTFNRELLDGVFILDENLAKFCEEEGKPLPAFWFGEGTSIAPDDTKPLTNSQHDRIACQTIAQILWDQDPSLTVEAIQKHPWIQKFGNGAQYTGKATIRNWIKDLNPKPPEARRGRPRKIVFSPLREFFQTPANAIVVPSSTTGATHDRRQTVNHQRRRAVPMRVGSLPGA
jgi:hypothetical protein